MNEVINNITEKLNDALNIPQKMLIFNYYIENGSMKNFQKHAPILYKNLTELRKQLDPESSSVTDFIETHLLEVTESDLTLSTQQLLKEHFEINETLTNSNIEKTLDMRLRNIARKNDMPYTEFKEKLERCEIYTKTMFRIINRLDISAYKAILQSIVITIIQDSYTNSSIKLEIFKDFDDSQHMATYEPNYLSFIRSRIPVYVGPVHSSLGSQVSYMVQGNTYYGERDLKLETIPSLTDDIIVSLKGLVPSANLTPIIYFKLMKMLKIMGNINYIGLDSYNLFQDLNNIVNDLGLNSIAELLRQEGFNFTPIAETHANFIEGKDSHELILMNYDKAQIKIDSSVVKSLQSSKIADTLQIMEGERDNQKLSMLVVEMDGSKSFVYPIISKNTQMLFKDGNTLNITRENMVMEEVV